MKERAVEIPEAFKRQVKERCDSLDRFDEYFEGLCHELRINPTLFASQHTPDIPRYARILGDDDVWWRCLVEWYVDRDTVTLLSIYRVRD
ncbi:MAG: hypothetical protein KJZ62_09860 [Fimbriimonadaceae bacterium]|nr:hypothetical protein [Fimbriimonadaceae bacterium]QOJ11895.1 MAG: hypothetical protein HRU74_07475 [Chthonomonadaceae bacterium]